MDRVVYLNNLYDYYKDLFTDKQKMYFESYYWDNLSLSEIAFNHEVSRNAVYNQLKIMEEKLVELESILHLYERKNKVVEILMDVVDDHVLTQIKGLL